MTVANGMLYNCGYSNNRVEIFSLIDPRFPELMTSFNTDSQPRHVDVIGRHLFVACHGAAKIQIYDMSSQVSPGLVGTIPTGAGPKMFVIEGDELYVVCNGSNTIEKFRIVLPSDNSALNYEKLGEASVNSPLCCDSNGEGVLIVCGLDANIRLVGTSTMNLISTVAIPGGGSHGTIVWANKTGALVSDAVNDGIHFVNCNDITAPSINAFVSTVADPEQIQIVGNRCYVPGLTTPGKMSAIDITDVAHPYEFKQIDLSVGGAGFTAYYQVGNNGYVYINGHFAPYNIDVIEVEAGEAKGTARGGFNSITAESATIGDLKVGKLVSGGGSTVREYRTSLSNTTALVEDDIIRLGTGADCALIDPATTPGQQLTITNVHAVDSSIITSAFAGFSGTLAPLASVVLVSMDFSGNYQWDAISSHGTIT
jgi:hypothetical protein